MKNRESFRLAGILGLLFVLLILVVRLVDVAPIGPEGTAIGLSHINRAVHERTGVNLAWYAITDALGYAAILVALLFAAVGLLQLIRRRSLLRVDRELLTLAGLYVAVLALYALFEVAIVNYRPVIMPGCEHPEASFPSSHTMLVCVILGSAMMLLDKYIRGRELRGALKAACGIAIAVTVIGRLISGVHWFTDILGGVLISGALLALYSGVRKRCCR